MSALSEARAVERSAAARHERLCRDYDRGVEVRVALEQAYWAWARAKGVVADLETMRLQAKS